MGTDTYELSGNAEKGSGFRDTPETFNNGAEISTMPAKVWLVTFNEHLAGCCFRNQLMLHG